MGDSGMKTQIPIRLLESEKEGKVWKVSLLDEGPSQNTYQGAPIFYTKELLEKVVKRFDGLPAYVYQAGDISFDHLPAKYQKKRGDLILNKIGWYKNPRLERINEVWHLVADLHIHEGAEAIRKFLKDAWDRGKRIGASIVADGFAELKKIKDRWYAVMEDLVPKSCDPVSNPATGARFIKLLESEGGSMNIQEKLLELAKKLAPDLVEEADQELTKDDQVELVDSLMEGLDTESFPEDLLRNQLARLREAIFTEEDEKAAATMAEIFGEEYESEEEECEGEPEESPKLNPKSEGAQKLVEQFGQEMAEKLVSAMGKNALKLLSQDDEGSPYPYPGPRGESEFWKKLEDLMELVKDEKLESAKELLTAIIGGEYPYPKPESAKSKEEKEGEEMEKEEKEVDSQVEEKVKDLEKKENLRKTKDILEKVLSESEAPEVVRTRVRKSFEEKVATREEIEEALKEEKKYYEQLVSETDDEDGNEETELTDTQELIESLTSKVEKLERERKLEKAQAEFSEQVKEHGLPTPAEQRLRKALFGKDEDGEEPTLDNISESVKQESEFVNQLIGEIGSQVTGMELEEPKKLTVEESAKTFGEFFDKKLGVKTKEEEDE